VLPAVAHHTLVVSVGHVLAGLVLDLAARLRRYQRGVQAPGPLLFKRHGVNAGDLDLGLGQTQGRGSSGQGGGQHKRMAAVQGVG
jgi:hypothetical protein